MAKRKGEDTDQFSILFQRILERWTARYPYARVHVCERREENSISRLEILPIQLDISRMRERFRIRRNIPRNKRLCRRVYDFRSRSRYSRTAIPMMIPKCSVDLIVARDSSRTS